MASTGNYIGNYKIIDQLSSDVVNYVYLAEHISSPGRPVVLKVFTTFLNSAGESNAFLQEAYFLVRLRHPFILPMFDSGIAAGYPLLVTEYLFPPVTLRDRINRQSSNPLPLQEALTICTQVGQALDYAHQQEIIHRQLKPEYILYNASGEALLTDFGLATVKTQPDNQSGADPYLAPEQLQGAISRSKLSDQYALGCIAYELFTGHQPAPDPIPPTQLNPSLTVPIEQAILKAIAKKLAERHANVRAFITALSASSNNGVPVTSDEGPIMLADTPTLIASAAITRPFSAETPAESSPEATVSGAGSEAEAIALASTGTLSPLVENKEEIPAVAPVGAVPTPIPIAESGAIIGSGAPISRRRRPRRLVAFVLLALVVLLIIGSLPFLVPYLLSIIPASAATVTIIPASKHLDKTYTLLAVTGTPDPTQMQVQARIISYTTPTKSMTVNATGKGHQDATAAKGTLILTNASENITIGSVNISGSSGVLVTNDAAFVLTIGGTTTVSAHAVNPGSGGNISAYDINGTYGIATFGTQNGTVYVQNTSAFTGGQDAFDYVFVQQSDVDNVTNSLEGQLMSAAQTVVQNQIHANEQKVQDIQCTPRVKSNHQANDKAANVTVQVAVTCSAEVYVPQDMKAMASQLLGADASSQLGANYALIGDTVTGTPTVASLPTDNGTVSYMVEAQGIWVYQFSTAQKQSFAQSIAGKTQADTTALLLKQQGVTKISINSSGFGNALPSSAGDIKFVIVNVAGLQATPGS
jgi:serine/threonine protein kinase